VGASLIAHGDSAPVFEPAKHNFNFMPLFVEKFIIKNNFFPVLFGRDAGRDASIKQGLTKPGGIIATICQKLFGLWQRIQEYGSAFIVACLPFSEEQGKGLAATIAYSMEF